MDLRWFLDGCMFVFIFDCDGDVVQLYIMSVEGGEVRKLIDILYGVLKLIWFLDGELVFVIVSLGEGESIND